MQAKFNTFKINAIAIGGAQTTEGGVWAAIDFVQMQMLSRGWG